MNTSYPPSPTPSMKNSSWHERVNSLKRGLNLMNRPLPDTPKTSTPSDETSSRSTTPKSVFDTIQRPPSVTLEKIKSKANATLDRMALLQQRYHQQKINKEHNHRGSIIDQNLSFDQWSSISPSPSHFRSGSMSSGINSSHIDLLDESHINLYHQRQAQQRQQQLQADHQNENLSSRGMSTSVFNLSQINCRPDSNNMGWRMSNPIQQAQSVAQLNCVNCSNQQQQVPNWNLHHTQQSHADEWPNQLCSQQQLNRSLLSLNVASGYVMPHHHNGVYPPPVFMNPRGMTTNMYPYPYAGGMPVMNPGLMAMPPTTRSRATSRACSRAMSPAMSRKSMPIRRKRSSYAEDELTDDENSDQDDRRSIISNRSGTTNTTRVRQRRVSSASQGHVDDDIEIPSSRNSRSNACDPGRGSISKPVQSDWLQGRRTSSRNIRESSLGSTLKCPRIYSDLDSEESGTRALVQAKIQAKLKEVSKQNIKIRKSSESESGHDIALKRDAGAQANNGKRGVSDIESDSNKNDIVENRVKENDEKDEKNSVKENDMKINDASQLLSDGSSELGPPPSTPEYEWECEFCTYVNEPKIKICLICCKTPSKPPRKSIHKTPSSAKEPKTEQKSNECSDIKITIKNKPKDDSFVTEINHPNDPSQVKFTSLENECDNSKKESLEDIWSALDDKIQATTDEVIRNAETKKYQIQKVSTASGPSTIKEIIKNNTKKTAKDIETSPAPQSTSTQTYESLPLRQSNRSGQDLSQLENSQYYKIQDIKPSVFPEHNSNEGAIPSHIGISSLQNDRERYSGSSDLRCVESFLPEIATISSQGQRQPTDDELMGLSKAQTELQSSPHSYSIGSHHYEQKTMRDPETELYILLKEAELYKFTAEELHAALKYCGTGMHPIQWLRENWSKLIQTVQSLSTKYGQERGENIIGTISQVEARDALRIHDGNIWQAVSECIEQRQKKFRIIFNKGNYSREDIVTALTAHEGNIEFALMDLGKTQLKPFLLRIHGSPAGVENESGVNISSQSPLVSDLMKSEIHDFLNVNVMESVQVPNATSSLRGDHTSQLYDHTNITNYRNPMIHHKTSYNSEAKDFTSISPQTEDSFLSNKNMLRDLEILIGNIEQNQAKQNEQVLKSIESMLGNVIGKREIDINETDTEVTRILAKSPITTSKTKTIPLKESIRNPFDIKNFVWQHIQEIVPNLVQQVEMELMEQDTDTVTRGNTNRETSTDVNKLFTNSENLPEWHEIDTGTNFLVEQIRKPNIKTASIREEVPPEFIYATEVSNFTMDFDRGLETHHEEECDDCTFPEIMKFSYKMYLAPTNLKPIETHSTQLKTNNVLERNQTNKASESSNKNSSLLENENEKDDDQQSKHEDTPELNLIIYQSSIDDKTANSNKVSHQNISHRKSQLPKNIQKEAKQKNPSVEHKLTNKAISAVLNKIEYQKKNTNDANILVKKSRIPVRKTSISCNVIGDLKNKTAGNAIHNKIHVLNELFQINSFNKNPEDTNAQDVQLSLNRKIQESEITLSDGEENKSVLSNNDDKMEIFQDAAELSSDEEDISDYNADKTSTEKLKQSEDEKSSDDELYSVDSDEFATKDEHNEKDIEKSSIVMDDEKGKLLIASSNNNMSLSNSENVISTPNQMSVSIPNKDFVPSSDPSKQNLSELVEDTQRLIKQMREEITIDEIESSGEEYTDDFSDDWDEDLSEEDDYEKLSDEEEKNDEKDFSQSSDKENLSEENDQEEFNKENIEGMLEKNHGIKNIIVQSNLSEETSSQSDELHLAEEIHSNETQFLNNMQAPICSVNISSSLHPSPRIHTSQSPLSVNTVVESQIISNPIEIDYSSIAQQLTTIEVESDKEIPELTVEPVLTNQESGLHIEPFQSDEPLTTVNEITETSIIRQNNDLEDQLIKVVNKQYQTPHTNSNTDLLLESSVTNEIDSVVAVNTTDHQVTKDEDGTILNNIDLNNSMGDDQLKDSSNANTMAEKAENIVKQSTSKIPKPRENIKKLKKTPTRSKSFSGPPAPIGFTSVKAIQQEFLNILNKQSQVATSITNFRNPPTVLRKKSITEAITKFTNPSIFNGPSTSNHFRTRTQPRIPKKKYHETCFSDDDYDNTTEEEVEPENKHTRKQSVPIFRAYPSVQEPKVENPEILVRKFVDEKLASNFAEAQIAAALVNMKFPQDASLWAAKECSDLDQAIALLQQECELCMGIYSMNQICALLKCSHKCCKQCAKAYFTVQITDRSINDCNCPFCKLPELHDQNAHEDENLEYFSNLDIFLKNILDTEVHELFQRKLRDRTLLQDPNFKWCIQCSSGFFARPKQKRLICPDCGSVTCSQCRITWEKQHEGISCEKFLEWKQANDPEVQAQGVQEHLAQNGIDCPKCKFRYSLARGGCMHFTCFQCKYEFCYGCAKPFMMGAKCTMSSYCAKLGLHAHHPRNCLFYLRDKHPLQLQLLLKDNGVPFDLDGVPIDKGQILEAVAGNVPARCPVPLQKETPKGLVDVVCNNEVPDNHAGLCRTHYVEYLTAKVATARIDPLPIFDLSDCVQELRRRDIPLPERGPWDTDEIYKNMCSEVIKRNIPLESN